MIISCYISTILILISIVYTDLRSRFVYSSQLVGLFLGSLFIGQQEVGWSITIMTSGTNIIFSCLIVLFTFIIMKIKKNETSFIDGNLGLGDILFFISISPLFLLKSFSLFLIVGFTLSIFIAILFRTALGKYIPLAGFLALFLLSILGIEGVLGYSLRYINYSIL